MSDLGADADAGEEDDRPGDRLGGGSDAWADMQLASGAPRDRQAFACPNCGHELSMYTEPDGASRAENVAARLADFFGSWMFMLFLAVSIIAWLAVNVVVGLLQPSPALAFSQLDIALAIVAAMQGPLILLTQRRDSERDRARDIEIFHIALNTEEDVHAIRAAMERQSSATGASVETDQPGEGSR